MTRRSVLCAALLLVALPAFAQQPAQAPPTQEASQVTLDEISQRAEDVATQLRDMSEAISDPDAFASLDERVFRFSRRIADRWRETDQILGRALRRGALETLASSWRALRTELLPLRADVDGRLARRETDLASLDRMKESWTWTLEHADSVGVPAPMIGRVQQTVAAIDATRTQIDARRNRLLVLQDAVSRAAQACDDAIARIADAREQAVSRIFADRQPPLWRNLAPLAATAAGSASSVGRSGDFRVVREAVQIYVQAYRSGFVVAGGIALLLTWLLYRARPRVRYAQASGSAVPDFVDHVTRSPVATAVLLAIVFSRPLRPDPPVALQLLIFLIGLPAALIVLRPALGRGLMWACRGFVALFVANVARSLLQPAPSIEQWLLLVGMAAAAALLFWTSSLLRGSAGLAPGAASWIRSLAQRVFAALGLAAALASAAASLGYLEFADFLGGGALAVVYLAVGVLAFRNATGGVIWLALVDTPLARLRAIGQDRIRLEAGLRRVLEVTSFGIWILFALQTFELLDPVVRVARSVLAANLQAGALNVSVGRILTFFAVLAVAWLTSRVVIFALEADVYPRMRLARGVPYALSTMVRYGLLLMGFFAALAALGLDLTRLTVLVSAFGLGLGFGMQQIVNNFISGLILLFERPIQVGDLVQMKDLSGEVLRIGIRSSTVLTGDGAEVIIPNSDLIQNDVTNWTLSDRRRRVTLDLGVAYGTEAQRVLALLVEVANADARVLTHPAPDALFTGFGASALLFQLRFWTEETGWMQVKSDLGVGVQEALRRAGIAMAITPVEVQVQSVVAQTAASR